MKKILLTMLTLLAWSSSVMAQDPEQVVGAYSCDLYISLGEPINDETEITPNVSVLLTRSEQEGCVNFELRNFSLDGENSIGDIMLPNIPLATAEDNVGFGENDPVRLLLMEGAIIADASLNPSTSYISGEQLRADVDVIWLMDESNTMPIYVRAIGTKQAAVNDAQVIGTYTTDLYISLGEPINDETEVTPNVKVQLTKGSMPGYVNFELRNFSLDGENSIGDILLPNIPLVANESGIGFGENNPVRLLLMEGAIIADASLDSSTSTINENQLTANVDVIWLMDENSTMPIYVRAIGSKDGAADGIDQLVTSRDIARSGIYSLSGVRMNAELNALPRVIYIVNGKKVVK